MRKSIKLISRSRGTRRTRRKRLSPPKRRNRSYRRQKVYKKQYQRGGSDGNEGDSNKGNGKPANLSDERRGNENNENNENENENNETNENQNNNNDQDCSRELEQSKKEKQELETQNQLYISHISSIYSHLIKLSKIEIPGQDGNNQSQQLLSGESAEQATSEQVTTDLP